MVRPPETGNVIVTCCGGKARSEESGRGVIQGDVAGSTFFGVNAATACRQVIGERFFRDTAPQ